jgi:hypothetical protein
MFRRRCRGPPHKVQTRNHQRRRPNPSRRPKKREAAGPRPRLAVRLRRVPHPPPNRPPARGTIDRQGPRLRRWVSPIGCKGPGAPRPARKARRPRIVGLRERGATPRAGMPRPGPFRSASHFVSSGKTGPPPSPLGDRAGSPTLLVTQRYGLRAPRSPSRGGRVLPLRGPRGSSAGPDVRFVRVGCERSRRSNSRTP